MRATIHDEPDGVSWRVDDQTGRTVAGGHIHDTDRARAWQAALSYVNSNVIEEGEGP